MSEPKPVLIVIAGPNGSGKTSVTKILRSAYDWAEGLIVVNPDDIAEQQFNGWNDVASIQKAARRADEIREECLVSRQGLLFETVLSISEKVDYIRRAKEAGFFIRLIFVGTESADINIDRIAWRVMQGGHSVPNDKVISRYERSMKQAIEAARIVDRAYFVDNTRDIEESPEPVNPFPIFRTVNGVVAKTYTEGESFPHWARSIYDGLQSSPL